MICFRGIFYFFRKLFKFFHKNLAYFSSDIPLSGVTLYSNNPYKIKYDVFDDIHKIANIEKKVPLEWIDVDNDYVKQELVDYMRPLIMGEPKQIYKDGVPIHLIRKQDD